MAKLHIVDLTGIDCLAILVDAYIQHGYLVLYLIFPVHGLVKQVTAVAFSDGADKIFSGGIDNDIKVWDLRKNEVSMKLQGHTETITSMQLSPDGSYLLTNSMDCSLRVWDMRPYAPQVRLSL